MGALPWWAVAAFVAALLLVGCALELAAACAVTYLGRAIAEFVRWL